jgi:hypothetical protein
VNHSVRGLFNSKIDYKIASDGISIDLLTFSLNAGEKLTYFLLKNVPSDVVSVGMEMLTDDVKNKITSALTGIASINEKTKFGVDYNIEEYTIDGETTRILKIQRNNNEYSICEICAPKDNPNEATITFMLPNTATLPPYFMDVSLMNYGGNTEACMVLQTRGSGLLYPLNFGFNNGSGRYNVLNISPDGTFELRKEVGNEIRKFKLGSLGILQDRVINNNASTTGNKCTDLLYNCYLSDQLTNTYKRMSDSVDCYKIEINGGDTGINGFVIYRVIKGSLDDFTDSDWVEFFKINNDNLKYKGDDIAVIKRKNGAFTDTELTLKDIGIDETNNKLYVKMSNGILRSVSLI